ncbi:MAG: hypothetical protein KGL39_48360 [Patescibacteria group bacterium]|nr:hypothetical protein [Patescibacteria group bacterium]
MTATERVAKARAADPAWWANWDAFFAAPIDRSPVGQTAHDALTAEFAAKLAAVSDG